MIALIVPALVSVLKPILIGIKKLPDESDNCAVKIFPALKEAVIVYGTRTGNGFVLLTHILDKEIFPVVIFAGEYSQKSFCITFL